MQRAAGPNLGLLAEFVAQSMTEALDCFFCFVLLFYFVFILTSLNQLNVNGYNFPFASVFTVPWLFFPDTSNFRIYVFILQFCLKEVTRWSLDFRTDPFLFSLPGLLGLKMNVLNVSFFVPHVKESELLIGHVYIRSFMCCALFTVYKFTIWLLFFPIL